MQANSCSILYVTLTFCLRLPCKILEFSTFSKVCLHAWMLLASFRGKVNLGYVYRRLLMNKTPGFCWDISRPLILSENAFLWKNTFLYASCRKVATFSQIEISQIFFLKKPNFRSKNAFPRIVAILSILYSKFATDWLKVGME